MAVFQEKKYDSFYVTVRSTFTADRVLIREITTFSFSSKKQEEMILNLNTNSAINQRTAEALCRWVEKIRIRIRIFRCFYSPN